MPGRSTGRDLHIDRPLSNVAMRYRPEGFIGDQIAPEVSVSNQSDSYYVWNIADVLRVVDDYRAPGREARRITRSLSSDTFFCKNHALKERIPYEDIANSDAKEIFGSRQAAGEAVLDQLALNQEFRIATMCTSGSNVGSYSAVSSAWSGTGSDPIANIDTAIDNVIGVTGVRPNSILFGWGAWKSIKRHADIIDGIFGDGASLKGGARVPSLDGIKNLFNLDRALIGGTWYNSAQEKQAASLSALWDDVCLLYYAPMVPRKDKASFMYTFNWDKVKGFNRQVQVFDREVKGAEEVQAGFFADEKITGSALGFLITGVNSSQ